MAITKNSLSGQEDYHATRVIWNTRLNLHPSSNLMKEMNSMKKNDAQKEIACFRIYREEHLCAEGELKGPLPENVTPALLVSFYKHMVYARTFDQKAIALQRTGQLGTYPSALGQEAINTALGMTMETKDVLVPYYRDHSTRLIRGTPARDLFRYWGGDERGSLFSDENAVDFPDCVPIATQMSHAAGVAAAMKIKQSTQATVATLGDGATSRGDFYESLNVAGVWQLPMVIVVNNNHWAISVPFSKQSKVQTIAQKAIAAEIHKIQVDGNDPVALLSVFDLALQRARTGKGATLVEAVTYRLGDHTTADDARRYRSDTELQSATQLEPMIRLRKWLTKENLWNDELEQKETEHCKARVQLEVKAYLETPPQEVSDFFDYVYEQRPAEFEPQLEKAKAKALRMKGH